ncbi:unnamed protein product [Scytosiphon promiscuus]
MSHRGGSNNAGGGAADSEKSIADVASASSRKRFVFAKVASEEAGKKRQNRPISQSSREAEDARDARRRWQQQQQPPSSRGGGQQATRQRISTRGWAAALLATSVGLVIGQQIWKRATAILPGFRQRPRWGKAGGERSFISEGNIFQVDGCPYALSKTQAEEALRRDYSNSTGNSITLLSHAGGRSGNHFMTLSSYLAMGYCCRSRLVTLPESDSILPAENGTFTAERRWFDFSGVTLPWPEYQEMGNDPEVCRPKAEDGGRQAFGYENVPEQLLECMNRVYLRGCEKAYLGNLVDLDAFCPERKSGVPKRAGSLVVHIRSGDIFDPDGEGGRRKNFGQPPLEYYLHVLAAKEWDDVTILTAAWKEKALNPTFLLLEMMAGAGTLGENVRVFNNRTLLTDTREMLCADALAGSRSSISFLTFAHSRATTFFLPSSCGKGSFRRMKFAHVKATLDNTTLLLLEKPQAEVYGIDWRGGAPTYSVYNAWHDNPHQLLEMATYRGIAGLRKCTIDPPQEVHPTMPVFGLEGVRHEANDHTTEARVGSRGGASIRQATAVGT